MHSNLLLRTGALASSLLLASGFVSYRAGALGWMITSGAPPIAPPPAPEYTAVDESATEAPAPVVVPIETGDQVLFHGSKSAFVAQPLTLPPAKPRRAPPAEETAVFSGSKSLLPAAPAFREQADAALRGGGGH